MGLYRGYIGIMEKKMETTIQVLGLNQDYIEKHRVTYTGLLESARGLQLLPWPLKLIMPTS